MVGGFASFHLSAGQGYVAHFAVDLDIFGSGRSAPRVGVSSSSTTTPFFQR